MNDEKMRIPASRNTHSTDVAMTPMIDVVFLLLIFFICTASFEIPEQILPSHLTGGSTTSALPPPPVEQPLEQILVRSRLQPGGAVRWEINHRVCESFAELRRILAAIAAVDVEVPVILDVAGEIPLGDVIDVYDLCRLVGFDRVQFAARATTGS